MCLITIATHLLPDIALSVSDTEGWIYRLAQWQNAAQTVLLFSPECPLHETKETVFHRENNNREQEREKMRGKKKIWG